MINWTYSPRRDMIAKLNRRMTQWRTSAPATVTTDRPIVTFTFDDFPKSAARGADIVEAHNGRAGFFACTAMAGQTGPMGEMFDAAMLHDLHARGHEIGAHSHNHTDFSLATPESSEAEIEHNINAFRELGLTAPVTSMAYPFGETRFETKQMTAKRFSICRGILPGINAGKVDRAQLRAMELDCTEESVRRAYRSIDTLARKGGWLIFFSHDVQDAPTQFGTTANVLRELCRRAQDAGAIFAAPTEAAKLAGVINS